MNFKIRNCQYRQRYYVNYKKDHTIPSLTCDEFLHATQQLPTFDLTALSA